MSTIRSASDNLPPGPQGGLSLPRSVHRLSFQSAAGPRELFLVGTAHVSSTSVRDVASTLVAVRPEAVAVELCAARYQTLTDREGWRRLDVFRVLREGKAALLLSSLVMTSFQRRIAKQLGVEPGAEMMEAIEWARANQRPVLLIDRDIQTTFRRTWARLSFWSRSKLLFQLLLGVFAVSDIDAEAIEKLQEEGHLGNLLESLAQALPEVKSTLIDERDAYMAEKLRLATGQPLVAVVGAGHVPGITSAISTARDLGPLETVPPPRLWPRVLGWLVPAGVVALLVYGFFHQGTQASLQSVYLWVGITGVLAALGAGAALGHPLTVLAAGVAAPITTLHPFLAAGWVAGLVQAWVRRPTVRDLEQLPEDITTLKGFFTNPVSRILLVVMLVNVAASLGTFLAGGLIAARTL